MRHSWVMGGMTVFVLGITVLGGPVSAPAQFLGQVSTARTLQPETNDLGMYLGVFEDLTTFFGQYRRGLTSSLDLGVQGGLIDYDMEKSDAGVIFGVDLKYYVMSARTDPFDMAIGARTSYYDVSNSSVFALGSSIILSRDYRLAQGAYLTPYGGVNIRLERKSWEVDSRNNSGGLKVGAADIDGDNHNTDLEIGGVAGVKWELSDLIDALGEIVIDDQWGLVVGLNFKL